MRVSDRDVDGFLLSERETETRARRRKPARVRSYPIKTFVMERGRRVFVGMVVVAGKGYIHSRERKKESGRCDVIKETRRFFFCEFHKYIVITYLLYPVSLLFASSWL